MYKLTGKDKDGVEKILDRVPDDFVEAHSAEYCQQFWPDYTDLKLVKIQSVIDESQE